MPEKSKELTDVEVALRELTTRLELLQTGIEERYDHIEQKLTRITDGLWGSSDDPGKGLIIRVDRLEQNEQRRDWWIKAMGTALLGELAVIISKWFHG